MVLNGTPTAGDTPLQNGDKLQIGRFVVTLESSEEAHFVIHPANIPSTVKEVIRGQASEALSKGVPTHGGTMPELLEQAHRLEQENYLLRVLYDAGKALQSKLSIDGIAEQVMSLVFRIAGVERGFIMFFDEQGQVARQTEVRYRRPPSGAEPQIIFSRSIMETVREQLQPILIMNAADDERFAKSDSMRLSGLRSAMVAPLASDARLYAILYVDNLEKPAAFTDEELNIFALVASQAAAAIDIAMTHQQMAKEAIERAALERFLSPEVVELVASNPNDVRLGGVNQKVTVLFADIRGFTALAEKMAPELVVEILNLFFTCVTAHIFGNGGTLDKYLGDGVMAVFGTPFPKPDDAANAVRTAVEIQKMMVELNRDANTRGWPELKVGIGINTGMVTAGNIGSPTRLDYTVIGDAVNVASRLMSAAGPGQIIISEETARELGKDARLLAMDPLVVKGKSNPIPVFAVVWQKAKRTAGKN